jgi:superfamily II DNA or RNA helicase
LEIVERFDNGDIDVLIASRILDEGIDIKNFKVLIIASAGLSFVKTIQRLGRGLRVTDEKKSVTVYDFIDNTNPKLLKHSKARAKTYKMFGYDDIIEIKETDSAYLRLQVS